MDTLKKMRIYVGLFLLMVVLNLVLLFVLFMRRPPAPLGPPEVQNPAAFISQELKFTDSQNAQFDKLRAAHHQRVMTERREMHEARTELFGSIGNNSMNQMRKDSLLKAIAQHQETIDQVTYTHFEQIYALCDSSQKKTFRSVVEQAMEALAHQGQPMRRMPNGPPHRRPPRE